MAHALRSDGRANIHLNVCAFMNGSGQEHVGEGPDSGGEGQSGGGWQAAD
jgi:hypothetical protein